MKQLHAFVSGIVQGVFFRQFTVETARKLGLVGWVRNLRDGRVEIVAEGNEKNIKDFLDAIKKGPDHAKVGDIATKFSKSTGEFVSFELRETV
jgi:acylphosphatase